MPQSVVVSKPTTTSTYKTGSTTLDTPHLATVPVLLSGCVLMHHSFVVIWNNPGTGTSTAIVNGFVIPMQFTVANGLLVGATVKVESNTVGSLLIATFIMLGAVRVML